MSMSKLAKQQMVQYWNPWATQKVPNTTVEWVLLYHCKPNTINENVALAIQKQLRLENTVQAFELCNLLQKHRHLSLGLSDSHSVGLSQFLAHGLCYLSLGIFINIWIELKTHEMGSLNQSIDSLIMARQPHYGSAPCANVVIRASIWNWDHISEHRIRDEHGMEWV